MRTGVYVGPADDARIRKKPVPKQRIHAAWALLSLESESGAAAPVDRSCDRFFVRRDFAHAHLPGTTSQAGRSLLMDLCMLWGIHYRLRGYTFHGGVDPMDARVLAGGSGKVRDRGGFPSHGCRAAAAGSQGSRLDKCGQGLRAGNSRVAIGK